MFRIIGQLLMWTGFFAGSYLAVQRLEDPEDAWKTITWTNYVLALAVGSLGVVMLRLGDRTHATHDDRRTENVEILERSTAFILATIDRLLKSREAISVFQVRHLIDGQMMEPINDFVAARKSLVTAYGLNHYASVMADFAMAERVLNRAWSASADGYVDEVWICVEQARAKMNLVFNRLAELRSAEQSGHMVDGAHDASQDGPFSQG